MQQQANRQPSLKQDDASFALQMSGTCQRKHFALWTWLSELFVLMPMNRWLLGDWQHLLLYLLSSNAGIRE